jgi:hypothetical protein
VYCNTSSILEQDSRLRLVLFAPNQQSDATKVGSRPWLTAKKGCVEPSNVVASSDEQ